MIPQPISAAPKDGTAILTDCGIVCYMSYQGWRPGWVSCDQHGDAFKCADEGYWYCLPKKWTPLPPWVLKS